ncbi:hypothetical protein CVT24_000413 [Panaeolus cyanescens]|uniref:HNH nuclease domain-containing protein n=1 Tax=Panaeolus cyanescens TaxID=181874 RepID=A0A409WP73_9AGAR|nr:hypothetical protein CVT24_000413 [Panaeolus cyanescens]
MADSQTQHSSRTSGTLKSSPNTRIGHTGKPGDSALESVDSGLKRRTRDAAPTTDRCIIENKILYDGVHLCHVFGRGQTKQGSMMCAIESNWNMEIGSLTLDARRNCFYARSPLHHHFDNGRWTMLPSLEVIQEYENIISDNPPAGTAPVDVSMQPRLTAEILEKHNKVAIHTYTVVPLDPQMADVCIHRQITLDRPTKATDFETYFFPYETPAPLVVHSHIHPKFAILELGFILSEKYSSTAGENLLDDQPHLAKYKAHFDGVRDIYDAWTFLDINLRRRLKAENSPYLYDPERKTRLEDPSYRGRNCDLGNLGRREPSLRRQGLPPADFGSTSSTGEEVSTAVEGSTRSATHRIRYAYGGPSSMNSKRPHDDVDTSPTRPPGTSLSGQMGPPASTTSHRSNRPRRDA